MSSVNLTEWSADWTCSGSVYVYNKYPSPSVYQLRKIWGSIKPKPHARILCRGFFPLINARARDLLYLWYTPGHKLMSFDILLGCFCSSRLCVASACNCGPCTGSPCACNHRNDLSDLFPPAFINSQMVQADSQAILEPVVPVWSLRMPASALSFLAYFFFFKNWRQRPIEYFKFLGHSLFMWW